MIDRTSDDGIDHAMEAALKKLCEVVPNLETVERLIQLYDPKGSPHPDEHGGHLDQEDFEKHRERHQQLHRALDELFADFIEHHPNLTSFLNVPFSIIMHWAYEQTIKPVPLQRRRDAGLKECGDGD